jgi:autotransporter-associated beta strand protein
MRLALLGLVASFSVQPLLAQDNLRVSQAPVTISATFVRTGAPGAPKDRPNDADFNVTTPAETARYGNGMVLRAVLGENASLSGWSLVAVWANWPETGNGYKFFARKKGETPVLVPDEILALELTDPYVAQNLTRRSGNIVAGSDTHKSLAQLTLGGLGTSEDDRFETDRGIANGVLFGTGQYKRPAGATTAIYLPQGDRFVGYGVADISEEENEPDSLITVTLSIGASHGVAASPFTPAPLGPAAGPGVAPESTGPESISTGATIITAQSPLAFNGGVIKASSGSLYLDSGLGGTLQSTGSVSIGSGGAALGGSGSLSITDTVSSGLGKFGSGILTLSSGFTYTGSASISSGSLYVVDGSADPLQDSGSFTIGSGALSFVLLDSSAFTSTINFGELTLSEGGTFPPSVTFGESINLEPAL